MSNFLTSVLCLDKESATNVKNIRSEPFDSIPDIPLNKSEE